MFHWSKELDRHRHGAYLRAMLLEVWPLDQQQHHLELVRNADFGAAPQTS